MKPSRDPITPKRAFLSDGPCHTDARPDFYENGKVAINELLWRYLPGCARLSDAEVLALDFWQAIDKYWQRHERECSPSAPAEGTQED